MIFTHKASEILWVDSCDNTQDFLWMCPPEIEAIATTNQGTGRGRRGRVWESPDGAGLALSWRAPTQGLDLEQLPLLSLAAGVALHLWIDALTENKNWPRLVLKWPNDLLWSHRKLAGILCESRLSDQGAEVIIGIGLNLTSHPQLPSGVATLSELSSSQVTRDELIAKVPLLLDELRLAIQTLHLDSETLLTLWRSRAPLAGTLMRRGSQIGRYLDIDSRGALMLDIEGELVKVNAGEVELISPLSGQIG